MDKNNEFYREIKSTKRVTRAEATIAWFYSGKKQLIIDVETRFPVYANGVYDCTAKLQAAVNAGSASLPHGNFMINSPIKMGL